jgi:hypothetical protein
MYMIFNDKLLKNEYNLCFCCKEYYTKRFCPNCESHLYTNYNRLTMIKSIFNKWNIPLNLTPKLLLIFSQLQTKYVYLHMDNYNYLLFKIFEYLGDFALRDSIHFITEYPHLWTMVLKIIVVALFTI